jgi:hypothetical protein
MQQLDPEYLAEMARQFGFLSAFLGGVATTFLAQLLTLHSPRKVIAWGVIVSTAAAVAFVVSVLGSTMLIAATHPKAPAGMGAGDMTGARLLAFGPFMLGLLLLLAALALAGWIRSSKAGVVTTALALAGVLAGGWTLVRF